MSQPQVPQRPSAANVVGRRRNDKDGVSRSDNQNWRQPARTSSNSSSQGVQHNQGTPGGPRSGESLINRGGERATYERLLFMHTCLIGQQVEVQTKNGHVYSGIFNAANPERDFGVVLKMARLVKDGPKGVKSELVREAARKPPIKSHIIYGKDLVQIIAKDVSLSGDAQPSGRTRENRAEIVTDAALSQGRNREVGRELKPWKPDDEAPENMNLSLNHSWSGRSWDQFETNKIKFGVETTYNEEIYTTKLERGPQTREREREAYRIAREIEGQQTRNMHVAEERGMHLPPEVEAMDEESRYSSVLRGEKDIGDDDEDHHIDDRNDETFGGSSAPPFGSNSRDSSSGTPSAGEAENKGSRPSSADSSQTVIGASKRETLQERRATSIEKGDVASLDSSADTHREHLRLRNLLVGDKSKRSNKGPGSPYNSPVGRGSPLMSPLVGDPAGIQALNLDPSWPQVPDDVLRCDGELHRDRDFKEFKQQKQLEALKAQRESFKKELEPRSPRAAPKSASGDFNKEGPTRPAAAHDVKSSLAPPVPAALQMTAQASAPPPSSLPLPTGLGAPVKQPSSAAESSGPAGANAFGAGPSPTPSSSSQAPASVPSVSNPGVASPSLSPSSSTASLASATGSFKKSTLNPNAKEFKLNPNAKAFTPSFSSPRPASPVVQSPAYIHASLPPTTPLQGVSANIQYMQQQSQPGQFSPYNSQVVTGTAVANATPYMQAPGGFVPGFPGGGVPGGGVLPGQPSMKMPPHSQQQVVGPYGQQQQVRYPPQPPPMQPGFLHPNNQLYSQQMMYAQAGAPVMYIPYPQGMMQGQPVPPPPQGHLPPPQPSQQSQPQRHRSGAMQGMHYGGAPSYLPGQQHHLQQPQMPHLHNAVPGGLSPAAMNPGSQPPQGLPGNSGPTGQSGGNGAGRGGGKGAGGGFQQQQ